MNHKILKSTSGKVFRFYYVTTNDDMKEEIKNRKCRKNTEIKNPKVARTKDETIMLSFECVGCDLSKSKKLPDY